MRGAVSRGAVDYAGIELVAIPHIPNAFRIDHTIGPEIATRSATLEGHVRVAYPR